MHPQGRISSLMLLTGLNNFLLFDFLHYVFFSPESLSFLHDNAYAIQSPLLPRGALMLDPPLPSQIGKETISIAFF